MYINTQHSRFTKLCYCFLSNFVSPHGLRLTSDDPVDGVLVYTAAVLLLPAVSARHVTQQLVGVAVTTERVTASAPATVHDTCSSNAVVIEHNK